LSQVEAEMTDAQLLDCFVANRDQAAFAALVRRHGPMVWGVCRRVLYSYHDAEDAFQASFLVLARRAASVAPRDAMANWLYGVAYQTARKARASRARKQARERQVSDLPEPIGAGAGPWHDLIPILDRELSRLPEKYRRAIVLCDLQGKSRKQAAGELALPEGTLSGRLTRGRAMLAKRLARHGAVPSGAALAAVLSQEALSASLSSHPLVAAVETAQLLTAGQPVATGLILARFNTLTQGVLKVMPIMKLKFATGVLLAAAAAGAGAHVSGRSHVPLLRRENLLASTNTVVNPTAAANSDPRVQATRPVQRPGPVDVDPPCPARVIHDTILAHLKAAHDALSPR
jgi:RNA polymerase sigma factor (sigma-70 family)